MFEPVASRILAMLFVDGQRGCPYFELRLLLLNVVGSSPLNFAKPEQDIFLENANLSIAVHTSLCVIFNSFVVSVCFLTHKNYKIRFLKFFYTIFMRINV